MTEQEFVAKFRGRFMLFVADAWSIRREKLADQGMAFDQHCLRAKELMREMYAALCPEAKANGTPTATAKRT